jgi:hypothetical protein
MIDEQTQQAWEPREEWEARKAAHEAEERARFEREAAMMEEWDGVEGDEPEPANDVYRRVI